MIALETPRLLFRPHEPGDREAYCAMEQDPEFRRYVGGAPRTREAAEERFAGALTSNPSRLRVWATVLRSSGDYIGRCGVYPHIEDGRTLPREGVLSYYLARAHWGLGLATEAGAFFIRLGFDELALDRIVTAVDARNLASLRVLEKLGFTLARIEPGPRTFHHFVLARPEIHR